MIEFHYVKEGFSLDDEAALMSWITQTIQAHDQSLGHLEYVFCSDEYLLDINRRFLDHDYLTDIITFSLNEHRIGGTLYISIDRVYENADLYSQNKIDELHRVMIHGVLHLIGYDDKDEQATVAMRKAENDALAMRSWVDTPA